MKKITIALMTTLLALSLTGCGKSKSELDDLIDKGYSYVVTFDGNGGKIGNYDTRQLYVKYDSIIIPPGTDTLPNATLAGYVLKGWYEATKDENGNLVYADAAWDFANDRVKENITLYAYWTQNYHVYAYYGQNNDTRNLADIDDDTKVLLAPMSSTYRGHTIIDYYYDEDLTEKVEFGKPISTYFEDNDSRDLYLYTKWIEGVYTLVSKGSELKRLSPTVNYYLLDDIDCEGEEAFAGVDLYKGIFEGNGHTIKNMKIFQTQRGNTDFALFKRLEDATIKNVIFDGIKMDITVNYGHPEVAFIAGEVKNSKIENVQLKNSILNITIDGSITAVDIFTGYIYRSIDAASTYKNCTQENNQINYVE